MNDSIDQSQIELRTVDNVVVAEVTGYYNDDTGREILARLDSVLRSGTNRLIIDFANCPLINSMGVASLLELTFRIREDHFGHIILSHITELMENVFDMAGILPLAEVASDIDSALELAKSKKSGNAMGNDIPCWNKDKK
ncbi:MAG: STAS domain-containing protein [Candidatus Ozemobacteraceae bacterium]